MSSGAVKPFVDFSVGTNNDTGLANAASIQPISDGEIVDAAVSNRGGESLRQRTEELRGRAVDSLFLENADRVLLISGPGTVSWPGSTTAAATGIPTLSDALWIIPMLTPGFPQTSPVPPVASTYGVIHLKRADSTNCIAVTSQRRSYAAGDQINITVTPGLSFSCTLQVEDTGALRRTINIVATGSTTLGATITALNALTPPSPDNTALVSAALENGGLSGDLLLTSQAKQYMSGNYDGEGHAITPANLATFFSGNPTQALAEGDTLCVAYADLYDTASNGGRRQSIPENSNTAVPSGSFFNSRVHPELLYNALPICKVVNGNLVFSTGVEILAGETNVSLSAVDTFSPIVKNGNFEHGVTANTGRYGISDWENRLDLAVNGSWQLSTSTPIAGAKSLMFVRTSNSAATARIEQEMELEVSPNQNIKVSVQVKQLIAPTAGTYSIILYWGDLDSTASGSTTIALQSLSTTDGSPRTVTSEIAVPSGKRFLKMVTVEVAGVTAASTGNALIVDSLQVFVEKPSSGTLPAANNTHLKPMLADAVVLEDPTSYTLGQLAALLRFDRTTPSGEGTVYGERKDQTYDNSHLPPALAWFGRLMSLGSKLLGTGADARKARINAPYNSALSTTFTLLWETPDTAATHGGVRIYASPVGGWAITVNAYYDGVNWNKDVAGTTSTLWLNIAGKFQQYVRVADAAWTTWTQTTDMSAPQATTLGNPVFDPLLTMFDSAGNRRVQTDHWGLPGGRMVDWVQVWTQLNSTGPVVPEGWTVTVSGSGSAGLGIIRNNRGAGVSVSNSAGTSHIDSFVLSYFDSNAISVLEWEALATALTGASPGNTARMGWMERSLNNRANFEKQNGLANWQFVVFRSSGSVTTTYDTGVPVDNTNPIRFRIEWVGANMPGSAARFLAYINGVLVATETSNFPAVGASGMSFTAEATFSSGAGGGALTISPLRYRSTCEPTDDAL